jgi:hypothetical protein
MTYPTPTILDLVLRSDFARADPERARAIYHESRTIARKPAPKPDKPR